MVSKKELDDYKGIELKLLEYTKGKEPNSTEYNSIMLVLNLIHKGIPSLIEVERTGFDNTWYEYLYQAKCPRCHKVLIENNWRQITNKENQEDFCSDCGQALDWNV